MATITAMEPGFVTTLVSALAAGSTGTANSTWFTASPRGEGADRNLTLIAVPSGAVTTVTVDIEVSSDGGVTWQKKHVSVALIATGTSTAAVEANIQSALLYRINVTTNTSGTSVTINGSVG